ncbi:hypothetical protein ELHBVWVY_CDS0001 [Staphylococcus phage PG-2021_90]
MLDEREPPVALSVLFCLNLFPLNEKLSNEMFSAPPLIFKLVIPIFSAGVSSINLIVVMSLPCPTKRELLGILIPVVR